MKKPKVIINTEINFLDELKDELSEYKRNGTLNEYGITGYIFEKGTVKLKPDDIIAIKYSNGSELYCNVVMGITYESGKQQINMRYLDQIY